MCNTYLWFRYKKLIRFLCCCFLPLVAVPFNSSLLSQNAGEWCDLTVIPRGFNSAIKFSDFYYYLSPNGVRFPLHATFITYFLVSCWAFFRFSSVRGKCKFHTETLSSLKISKSVACCLLLFTATSFHFAPIAAYALFTDKCAWAQMKQQFFVFLRAADWFRTRNLWNFVSCRFTLFCNK